MGFVKKIRSTFRYRLGTPRLRDYEFICRQLGALLEAGIPMQNALLTVAQTTEHLTVRRRITNLAASLQRGASLEDALRDLDPPFPLFFTNMLILGGKSGSLVQVLFLLERYYLRLNNIRRTIFGVIWYPIVMMFFYCVVWAITLSIIASIRGNPSTTDILGIMWGLFQPFFLSMVFAYALVHVVRDSSLSVVVDRVVLKIPIVGELFLAFYLGTFFRSAALCMDSGMLLHDGFTSSMETINNLWIRQNLRKALKFLQDGESLTNALSITEIFPREALSMARVADESAAWNELFNKLADYYFNTIEDTVPGITKAFFPLFMIMIALIFFGGVGLQFLATTLFFFFFILR